MANGRVRTGFSKPYIALYAVSGGVVSYSSGRILARGVSVSLEPEVADNNDFYADNEVAESVGGKMTGGTITLTVDGLKDDARKLAFGLPTPEAITVSGQSVNVYSYGDDMEIPYVGIGYITRYMSDGVETYVPTVITKARFNTPSEEAATQEDSIEWQTEEITANLYRADDAKHNWKKVSEEQDTEAKAEAVIKALLGIS